MKVNAQAKQAIFLLYKEDGHAMAHLRRVNESDVKILIEKFIECLDLSL